MSLECAHAVGTIADSSSHQTRLLNERSLVEHITKHRGCQYYIRQRQLYGSKFYEIGQRFS